ncbi:MAG: hypothetical protein ABMB14_38415, partial [Myxococcota bacterium]
VTPTAPEVSSARESETDRCSGFECGNNGTSSTGLVHPVTPAAAEHLWLEVQSTPAARTQGCSGFECGNNGPSSTGLVRTVTRPTRVSLPAAADQFCVDFPWIGEDRAPPPDEGDGGCQDWQCGGNGTSSTGLVRPVDLVSAAVRLTARR